MEVLELQDQGKEAWDRYVYDSPQATIYHLAGWKHVMGKTFGLRSHYLCAKEGDQVVGCGDLVWAVGRAAAAAVFTGGGLP